jgi:membrane-bound metal-dependent hydrolase YbcI (DUF457 family)
MFFWHVGGTIALVRYTFRDERMDLRFLILGAVLPDLVDTPIGLAAFGTTQSVRLVGHSLIVAGGLMVAVLLTTRRGRPRKRWMPVAIGVLLHLFLDAMWADSETLWWPFLGWAFSAAPEATASEYLGSVFTDWRMWSLELVGVTYLAVLGRRARLSDCAARDLFRTTGRVDVPIGPQ